MVGGPLRPACAARATHYRYPGRARRPAVRYCVPQWLLPRWPIRLSLSRVSCATCLRGVALPSCCASAKTVGWERVLGKDDDLMAFESAAARELDRVRTHTSVLAPKTPGIPPGVAICDWVRHAARESSRPHDQQRFRHLDLRVEIVVAVEADGGSRDPRWRPRWRSCRPSGSVPSSCPRCRHFFERMSQLARVPS